MNKFNYEQHLKDLEEAKNDIKRSNKILKDINSKNKKRVAEMKEPCIFKRKWIDLKSFFKK